MEILYLTLFFIFGSIGISETACGFYFVFAFVIGFSPFHANAGSCLFADIGF